MSTHTTPVFGIAYCDTLTALVDVAAVTESAAKTTEAALAKGGIAPADVAALIASGAFSDSGWITLTPATGFTSGNSLGIRRIGKRVSLRGTIVRTAGVFPTTAATVFNLPDNGWRPTAAGRYAIPGFASATANGLIVNTSSSSLAVQVAGVGASTDTGYFDGVSWFIA